MVRRFLKMLSATEHVAIYKEERNAFGHAGRAQIMNEPWVTGPYASFMAGVVKGEGIVLAGLLRPEVLDGLLLKGYGPELMPAQLPVLVSQWAKFYFMLLMPHLLVSRLVYGWRLPLDTLKVHLGERGWADGLVFERGSLAADEPWYDELLENLGKVIDSLATYGKLAPAVLWGNAGDYLELNLQRLRALDAPGLQAGFALLGTRLLPDGQSNPLFEPVHHLPDGQRQRRSCCLAYKVEWVGHCEHCPLRAHGQTASP